MRSKHDTASSSKFLKITQDRELLENISLAKKAFIRALSLVGNSITHDKIEELHTSHKGIKISQGNELQKCPYQVLDIVRDFDAKMGLNIRILHWWGRGAFFLVFYGSNHPQLVTINRHFTWLRNKSFDLCKTDLWDYQGIIDQNKVIKSSDLTLELLANHLNSGLPFQIIKPIIFDSIDSLREQLLKEFENLYVHHIEK